MSGNDLSAKVRRSILALQGRQAIMLLLNLGVGVILARKLGPELFGLYGIATFCLSLIALATDFGIAGSLVQRKESFGEHEISVAFSLQLAVACAASAIVWFAAPMVLLVYQGVDPALVWIIRSLSIPILLSPVGTTARLQLEREIQFTKIASIDLSALVGSNIVILAMVFTGHGVWSLAWGNVASALIGALHAWSIIRFHPRIRFDRKLTRELFSFGMFFQFGNIANAAAGWIVPLVAGTQLGPAAVGLLTWASSNGRRPLMVVDNVMRVAFPHFSRLQNSPSELSHQVSLYFRRLLTICYPWAYLGFVLGAPMTTIVYTDRWLPGLVALQLFALGLVFDLINWICGMTVTAIGGVRTTAKWTFVKSAIAIVTAVLGAREFGIVAIPIAAMAGSAVSGAGLYFALRKRITIDTNIFWKPGVPYVVAAAVFHCTLLIAPSLETGLRWPFGIAGLAFAGFSTWNEFRSPRVTTTTTT